MKMKVIYPNLWLSHVTSETELQFIKNEWIEILNKLKDEEILYGLKYCKLYEEYPPSIAKFIKIAIGLGEHGDVNKHYKQISAKHNSWDRGHMTVKQLAEIESDKYRYFCDRHFYERFKGFADHKLQLDYQEDDSNAYLPQL